jgi:hypothetical protein
MPRREIQPRRRAVKPADEQIIPTPGSQRPAVVDVRLIGPTEAVDAALASLADFYGDLLQLGPRQRSRHNADHILARGTLIVPVPRD